MTSFFWLNSLNQKYAPFPPGMLLVSFDVISLYPNIMLDHGIRAVFNRDSESPSVECIIDAIKIIRRLQPRAKRCMHDG